MKEFKEFLVKSLKLYSNIDYFYKDNIRYHNIFHYPTAEILLFELILINKNYGKKDWNLELDFEIDFFNALNSDEPFSSLQINKVIKKNEYEIKIVNKFNLGDLVFYGEMTQHYSITYRYKEDIVAYNNFITEFNENLTSGYNPYFDIQNIKLFRDDKDEPQVVFDKSFIKDINLYLELSYELENIEFFTYELFIIVRNSLSEKLGEICYKGEMHKCDEYDSIELCLTDEIESLVYEGTYSVEILFFGLQVGKLEFKIADYDKILSEGETKSHIVLNTLIEKTDDDCFAPLNELVGLDNIKKEIKKIRDYVNFLEEKEKIVKEDIKKLKLHLLFIGNPGTSKTKVALMLGKIFKEIGVLSNGIVHVVNRNHLVGSYIGETAIKTTKAIEEARGGILFIDEAYSIFRENSGKDYGIEAIEILIKEMSDGPGDLIIIAAGYPKDMDIFLKSNQGLASRFKYIFRFHDFTVEELLKIAKKRASIKGLCISDSALSFIKQKVKEDYNKKDEMFGNARYICNIIDKAEINLASRTFQEGENDFIEKITLKLEIEDFENLFDTKAQYLYKKEIDETLYLNALKELNSLVGIKEVKNEIKELSQILRYYREENIDYNKKISLHSVFKGNPGTGKTTVARIIAKLYKSLGLLEKGHLVECDRAGLVAEYVGQTAIKTEQMIQRAMGGVLFIDEAYSLYKSGDKDFGNEAIEILLKRMEDYRGQFAVICAGYTDEIDKFLYSNPGLKSRFDKLYTFQDYSIPELNEIALKLFKENELNADNVSDKLLQTIECICKDRDRYFGNAREIRNIVERIIRKHDLRLSKIDKNKRTSTLKNELIPVDLDIDIKILDKTRPKIGFRIYEDL